MNKPSGFFDKQEYFPHLQLFIEFTWCSNKICIRYNMKV